jgi:6-phosphogluconolactonase
MIHPTGKFLYASNRGYDSLACFKIDARDGKLISIDQAPTEKAPQSFDLDPEDRSLYAEGKSSDKIVLYRIDSKFGNLHRSTTLR